MTGPDIRVMHHQLKKCNCDKMQSWQPFSYFLYLTEQTHCHYIELVLAPDFLLCFGTPKETDRERDY